MAGAARRAALEVRRRKAGRSARVSLPDFLRRAQVRSLHLRRLLTLAAGATRPPPGVVHELHRELRRARIDVRVLRRSLPKGERAALRGLEEGLDRLSKLAGEARDSDVLLASLSRLTKGAPPEVRREARSLGLRLSREATVRHRNLRTEARKRLRRASERLPPLERRRASGGEAARRFQRVVTEELGRAHEDLVRSRRRAARRPSVRRLHRLRISLRRLRHLRTSIAQAPERADLDTGWKRLQRDLGVHHDLAVLEELLRSSPRSSGRTRLRKLLREQMDQRVARARHHLEHQEVPGPAASGRRPSRAL